VNQSSVEVEFYGGPLDGSKRELPTGTGGAPERQVIIETMGMRLPNSNTYPVVKEHYLRRLNATDHGGLWEYVWVPPPPGGWS
jgi:hypothetical protein